MSDNVEKSSSSTDETATTTATAAEQEVKSDNLSSPSVRLFGQFKPNGFGFNNLSTAKDKTDENHSSSTYFTSSLSKISSTITSGFGSTSTPLAASLASLGANKPLFGGLSGTTPSSFTDLKASSLSNKTNHKEENEKEDEKDDKKEEKEEGEGEEEDNKGSLLENVAEYEAKRASTHPATTIQGDTSTGEENEITKFQMAGKLFMYNGEQQQFVERGYGILKINESHDPSDWDRLQARIIMRLDKCYRVILNSPLFPKMTVERATDRSVRFGAQDESQLRVFIIKASSHDCTNLCKELQSRIQILERQQISNSPTKSSNTSASSDLILLDESPPKERLSTGARKRSHSKSDSDGSESTSDINKKTKVVEGSQSTSQDDSLNDRHSVNS